MKTLRSIAVGAALCLAAGPLCARPRQAFDAHAPKRAKKTPQAPSSGASEDNDAAPPPYEPDLLKLSEIVGALAYLRPLCGAQDGDRWRAEMAALLKSVGGSETTRDQLAGAYNKGFRDFELIYRACTPNARRLIARYLAEGDKLTRRVRTDFGGG